MLQEAAFSGHINVTLAVLIAMPSPIFTPSTASIGNSALELAVAGSGLVAAGLVEGGVSVALRSKAGSDPQAEVTRWAWGASGGTLLQHNRHLAWAGWLWVLFVVPP